MKADLKYAVGILHPRKGGTGLTDVGPFGSVLTSDGARPLWLDMLTNPFLSAPALFIDPVNGNNGNNGLQQLTQAPALAVQNPGPLKTWAELRRRIGPNKLASSSGTTTITILSDLPTADKMLVDFGAVGNVVIQGTPTVSKATSNSSAFTARVAATNTPNQLTDGATVWTGFIGLGTGQVVAILSGNAAGSFGYGIKDMTAGALRCGTFGSVAGGVFAELGPAAGIFQYQVQRYTATQDLAGTELTFITPSSGTTWTFQNLTIRRGRFAGAAPLIFNHCAFGANLSATAANLTFNNCDLSCNVTLTLCATSIAAGIQNGAAGTVGLHVVGGTCRISSGFLTQDNTQIDVQESGWIDVVDVGMMDFTLVAASGGAIFFRNRGRGLLETFWGASAVANAVPCVIGGSSQVDATAANTRTALASAPAAAVKIGTAATLAAWPAAVATKTFDANSDATFVHA